MKLFRILPLVAAFIAVVALGGCDPVDVRPEEMVKFVTYPYSYSPTPVKDAARRYSDFKYEIRKVGEQEFTTFRPVSIKPTADGSVSAEFKIAIPEPKDDERYETRNSYKLDGEWHVGELRESVLRANGLFR